MSRNDTNRSSTCRYLYTDSLQGYKSALQDVTLHYEKEISKVLGTQLTDYLVECLDNHKNNAQNTRQLMKEQLRLLLQKKENIAIPSVSG